MKIKDIVFVFHLVEHERVAWHGRYHAHERDEFEIHYFVDGYGVLLCGKTRRAILPGKLFVLPPGEFHSIIPDPQSCALRARKEAALDGENALSAARAKRPISYYAILFSLDKDRGCADEPLYQTLLKTPEFSGIGESFRLQCKELTDLFQRGEEALTAAAEHLLLSLLFRYLPVPREALNRAALCAEPSRRKGRAKHAQVTKALALMQANVRNNLAVEELARIIGISTEHLIRVFNREVGMTPYQYMLRIKMEGASGLLISTPKQIYEIAEWFGFENQFHFSRIFKKCTGLSPGKYRKTYLQTVDFVGKHASKRQAFPEGAE